MNKKIIVAVSGYFDPLHVGHIEYFERAKELGDELVVIVNNDEQAKLKKGSPYMKQEDRMKIVSSLKFVDKVFLSIDEDISVCKSLEEIKPNIFAKGGDRNIDNIPEKEVCDKLNIIIIDGLGEKIESSSYLIKKIMDNKNE